MFKIRPGETIHARVKADRHDFADRIELGGDDSGRNLPFGCYVDNIGLNGLLIVEGQTEREFVITASPVAKPGRMLFHLRATADGGQCSPPVILEVMPAEWCRLTETSLPSFLCEQRRRQWWTRNRRKTDLRAPGGEDEARSELGGGARERAV
jgi:hypothetical protein